MLACPNHLSSCLNHLSSCRAGKGDDAFKPDIQLNGEGIEANHCTFDNEKDTVFITPTSATAHVFINGKQLL